MSPHQQNISIYILGNREGTFINYPVRKAWLHTVVIVPFMLGHINKNYIRNDIQYLS